MRRTIFLAYYAFLQLPMVAEMVIVASDANLLYLLISKGAFPKLFALDNVISNLNKYKSNAIPTF